MIRIFFKLYLAVLIPLLILTLLPVNPITPLIDQWSSVLVEEQFRGTFYLLERDLAALPQQQWPQYIKKLSNDFGRELRLVAIDASEINSATRSALLKQGHAYVSKPVMQAWRRINNSGYALVLPLGESLEDRAHRNTLGTAQLIRNYLRTNDDPVQGLRELAPRFGFPLAMQHEADLNLDARQHHLLHQGRVVLDLPKSGRQFYYTSLNRGDWVIVAGPVNDHNLSERATLMLALMPATLLAIAVILWLRPLWRDLKRLNSTAVAFGEGNLGARSQLPRRSTLTLLGTAFNNMAQGIQRLIESQKELMHAVSHEFKTPVARLRFALEMLRNEKAESKRERYLSSIENDLDELENLIGELLNHARYDRPDTSLVFQQLDIAKWVQRRVLVHQSAHPNITIKVEVTATSSKVEMDEKAMDKVLNNLLSNATRYAHSFICVNVMCDGDEVVLSVEDDGPGIPDSEWESVFLPFYRLESGRERSTGGSGLGLAIVQRIAERHRGRIICERSSYGGARFCMRWPRKHETAVMKGR